MAWLAGLETRLAGFEAWLAGFEAWLAGFGAWLASFMAWLADFGAWPAGSEAWLSRTYDRADIRKFFTFYRSSSPIRAAAEKAINEKVMILSFGTLIRH